MSEDLENVILSRIGQDREEFLKLLISIARIGSPTGKEARKIETIKETLKSYGLNRISIDTAGNCIFQMKTNSTNTILVVAHTDTACDAGKTVLIKQDSRYVYGHGVCDNSTGIAAVLTTIRMLKEHNIKLPANLIFGFTVGEEGLGGKRGMKQIMKDHGHKINAVINVESHNIGRITNQVIAQFRCLITINTKQGGHSFRDFGRPNTNVVLAKIISDFSKSKLSQINGKTTFNVAQLKSEGSINSIPTNASALFEIRSENKAGFKSAKNKFLSIVNSYKKTLPEVSITIDKYADVDVVGFPKTHKLYKLIIDVQKTLGIESKIDSGNTDGDVSLAMGIPTVTIGVSIGFNTHSLGEYMEKKSFILGIKQVFLTVNNVMNNI